MPDQDCDALVVGARVAGATAAALLGDAGYRVLLVDHASFPSATLSTHFFRGAGLVAVLDRLGVLDRVRALGSPPLVHDYSYADGAAEPAIGPPQEPGAAGYCLSVRREPLDAMLVQRATRGSCVGLAERTRFLEPLWREGRVVGARLATPAGERRVRARIVVGADGLHQNPWTGHGMDMAGTHATFLAEALLAWFGGTSSEDQALAAYHERRNAHGLPAYRETVALGRDLRQLAAA